VKFNLRIAMNILLVKVVNYFSNTSSSGRGQRGINFKDCARNGRAAELGVIGRSRLVTEL